MRNSRQPICQMRLLIRLVPLSEPASLSLDNYPFAALIYRSIWTAAPDYAEFLHGEGYPAWLESHEAGRPNHKRFKFFVFSRVEQPGNRVSEGRQWFRQAPIEWRVSSPAPGQMEALAVGLIARGVVSIGDNLGAADFGVMDITEIPPPAISRHMRFKTISPLFLSVDEKRADGSRAKRHLRAEDPRFGERVRENLIRKYQALTGSDPVDDELEFKFEGVAKPQLAQYKGTHHHCYMGEIAVSGSEELIRLGWECGFGEANSKGFGMVK